MWINDNKPVTMPIEMISCQWGWMMCPPGDQFVTGSLRRWGVYSETELLLLKQLVAGKRALIVGGNIGAIAAPLTQIAEYVEVYEPQPVVAEVLEANMQLAQTEVYDRDYVVINGAVGAQDGVINVPVVRFDADCNMGRIGKENWGSGQEVPLYGINPILAQGEFDFVLLDVEGMELEILKAAKPELLPDLMWVECDREDTGKELIEYIIKLGFSPYWMITPLTPNGMNPMDGPWNLQSSFNLLCVKQPALFPLPNVPQYLATVEDSIGNCPADMLIWDYKPGIL